MLARTLLSKLQADKASARMPAVALAWAAPPPFRPLGRLTQIPPFNWLAAALYHLAAHALWIWNRACGRW